MLTCVMPPHAGCMCTGNFPIIDLLLLEGAEAGAATYMGDTALQLAARSGHERVAARLLQPQRNSAAEAPPPAHLHAADRLGWTALHCACQHGSLPVVHLLLQVRTARLHARMHTMRPRNPLLNHAACGAACLWSGVALGTMLVHSSVYGRLSCLLVCCHGRGCSAWAAVRGEIACGVGRLGRSWRCRRWTG